MSVESRNCAALRCVEVEILTPARTPAALSQAQKGKAEKNPASGPGRVGQKLPGVHAGYRHERTVLWVLSAAPGPFNVLEVVVGEEGKSGLDERTNFSRKLAMRW